ncbi:MAG TPA: helix-turn-helix domain-containing protein [Acidimicrobiia bacterium]|nr:helix-turn-helix domain-containing protein [Acidimicrobiia bacterium]
MRVAIVPVTGCFTSGLSTLMDVLQTAEALRQSLDAQIPSIEVEVLGVTDNVVTRSGMTLAVSRRIDQGGCTDADVLVVPSLGAGTSAAALEIALARDDVRALTDVLRSDAIPPVVGAACSGTFVLAQAGLLDGHIATTSWFLTSTFQQRYPRVGLDMTRMVVRSGRFVTAGAGFAHIDLALSLLSGVSRELAAMVARYMLVDERPSPTVQAAQTYLGSTDQLLTEFETWVRAHLSESISISDAAAALGTTRKTLERHTRERAGTTPHAIVQRIRAERAAHLRRTTELNMTQIARAVGYRNASTLRSLLTAGQRASAGPG